jgi:hypothetical protein
MTILNKFIQVEGSEVEWTLGFALAEVDFDKHCSTSCDFSVENIASSTKKLLTKSIAFQTKEYLNSLKKLIYGSVEVFSKFTISILNIMFEQSNNFKKVLFKILNVFKLIKKNINKKVIVD